FISSVNLPGTQRTKGLTLEYSQQLVFLPGPLKGFSVFGSLTRNIADRQLLGNVPKSANGGIRYHYGRWDVQAARARCEQNAAGLANLIQGPAPRSRT
ncbi:MAG: hypothetical protein HYS13_03720, partial [Planctomycetia bacterium]|nr:hypothetical protein [Planctomycetia bacterium]